MKTLYFDCLAGASGDMILGALVDLGLLAEELRRELEKFPLRGYRLEARRVVKRGISATKMDVVLEGGGAGADHQEEHASGPHGRHLGEILHLIGESDLDPWVKERAARAFRRLGEVEAGIHGVSVESIHFHEVGAVDSIVDVVGAFAAFRLLGAGRALASPVHTGRGWVESAHGSFPIPGPATLELMRGAPIYSRGIERELLTPTGALLLTELADSFGPCPPMRLERVGYGAGSWDLPIPNVLRVLLGEEERTPETETVAILETNLDDMNPQFFQHLFEGVLERGALDVFAAPVVMKKGRPGQLLTVLCPPQRREAIASFLFRESTTLGVRWREAERVKAERETLSVDTPYGPVRVKVARLEGSLCGRAPEYEDCRRIAAAKGVPLKEVYEAALVAARRLGGEER
ncbi:MAG: nickel pincer cofactor biosynthesis protein LarC [Nitrospinota bacterium]